MRVFIDESGVGLVEGHTVFAFLFVEDDLLSEFDQKIVDLERELRIRKFHWAKSEWRLKEKFVTELAKLEFSLIIAKTPNPIKNTNTIFEQILAHALVGSEISHIYIDGKKTKAYERRVKKVLRDKNISTKKLRTVNDTSVPAIRAADALAGLVRYNLDKKRTGSKLLYDLIEPKISLIIETPPGRVAS